MNQPPSVQADRTKPILGCFAIFWAVVFFAACGAIIGNEASDKMGPTFCADASKPCRTASTASKSPSPILANTTERAAKAKKKAVPTAHLKTRKTSKPRPRTSPKTDPRFRTCREANVAGYGPYSVGDPEYSWYIDRDHDGLACETR